MLNPHAETSWCALDYNHKTWQNPLAKSPYLPPRVIDGAMITHPFVYLLILFVANGHEQLHFGSFEATRILTLPLSSQTSVHLKPLGVHTTIEQSVFSSFEATGRLTFERSSNVIFKWWISPHAEIISMKSRVSYFIPEKKSEEPFIINHYHYYYWLVTCTQIQHFAESQLQSISLHVIVE